MIAAIQEPSPPLGLTIGEADRRRIAGGANVVRDAVQTPLNRALRKFWAPVPFMLEAAILLQGVGFEAFAGALIRRGEAVGEVVAPGRRTKFGRSAERRALGVRTVMVTGDAPVTARVVADAVGIDGPICTAAPLPSDIRFPMSGGWETSPIAAVALGFCDLVFCVASLAVGRFVFGLHSDALRTLTVVTLMFSGQAIFYVSR